MVVGVGLGVCVLAGAGAGVAGAVVALVCVVSGVVVGSTVELAARVESMTGATCGVSIVRIPEDTTTNAPAIASAAADMYMNTRMIIS